MKNKIMPLSHLADAVELKLASLRNTVDPLHDIKPPVVSVEYNHHGYTVFGSCSKQSGVYDYFIDITLT
jgi:hypothetical protein